MFICCQCIYVGRVGYVGVPRQQPASKRHSVAGGFAHTLLGQILVNWFTGAKLVVIDGAVVRLMHATFSRRCT
jgi:hypothetical protein